MTRNMSSWVESQSEDNNPYQREATALSPAPPTHDPELGPCDDDDDGPPSHGWSFADTGKRGVLSRDFSPHATDEVFNSVSHLSAAMLSLLGMVLLISQSGGNAWKIVR